MQERKEISFFESNRLPLFNAIVANDISIVESLLDKEPTLIQARTTTKGSTLLHIAAQRNNKLICMLLLKKNHETNPLDKEGVTPYQQTVSEEIKEILVRAHLTALCGQFYPVSADPRIAECMSKPRKQFIEFLSENGSREMSTVAFGVTSLKWNALKKEHNTPSIFSYFREDILMTPYYGELLVIHENEQAVQLIEKLEQAKDQKLTLEVQRRIIADEMPFFEARAFLKFVSKGLELFPFLSEYPKHDDRKDVVEAKKMFLIFGVIGFAGNYQQCSEQQKLNLQLLPNYHSTMSHTVITASKENSKRNTLILNEMNKYTTDISKIISYKT